jgi:hypothetical protein
LTIAIRPFSMIANYTQSRAAILCFGGWGLQVMFHLLPRLQAAQEQRAALGSLGPNLHDVTSFGTLVADPEFVEPGQVRFELFRPHENLTLPPYYMERTLGALGTGRRLPYELTAAERRAVLLLDATRPHLTTLGYGASDFRLAAATGQRRPTRRDLFLAATHHADPVARLLETHLLDPIRHDSLDPDDPFVQTTLYVVAPLFEPLSSALLWPALAQLLERNGRQHISQVVALFASGSYAQDLSRAREDAVTYVALQELELLSGVAAAGRGGDRALLEALVRTQNPTLAGQVGAPLFDYIYLLDREKSNQGLADDSHEVAILAANALEAHIVSGGNLHVQEQLGIGLHAGESRPYSLLGAATDYVPVAQILHAINRQEESRLVREWVLRSTPEDDQAANPLLRAMTRRTPRVQTLRELGLEEAAALTALVTRLPDLFANLTPQRIADLRASRAFVFPDPVAAELRRRAPREWALGLERHLLEIEGYADLAVGSAAVDEAWGLRTTDWYVAGGQWAADQRIFPTLVRDANRQIVDLVAASPAGLNAAREQVQRWRAEAEQMEQALAVAATPNQRELAQIQRQMALRSWCSEYEVTIGQTPSLVKGFLRAALVVGTVALMALGYLAVMQQSWDNVRDGLALAGFAAGVLGATVFAYRAAMTRVSRLRRERVDLAVDAMTQELRTAATDGLLRMVRQLNGLLRDWQKMLDDAHDELQALAAPPIMPAAPPADVRPTHLYQPYLSEQLWQDCLTYLRDQQDAQGDSNDVRLDNLWGDVAWRRSVERIFRGAPTAVDGDRQAAPQTPTLAELIRGAVRRSVAPVSLSRAEPARAALIRTLAQEYSIEHMLWRSREEEEELQRQLRALETTNGRTALMANLQAFPRRHYIENAWNRAKPTANYDVSDRLAVYGVNIDFVAASGNSDTDLTRTLLQEYSLTLLPSQDPFSITFVRTVHGLGLDDLGCMQRYRAEFVALSPEERRTALLVPERHEA